MTLLPEGILAYIFLYYPEQINATFCKEKHIWMLVFTTARTYSLRSLPLS